MHGSVKSSLSEIKVPNEVVLSDGNCRKRNKTNFFERK